MEEKKRDYSFDTLLPLFTDARWPKLSAQERLDVLQKMENLLAAEQGRRPMRVKPFGPIQMMQKKYQNLCGYHNLTGLHLNANYFRNPKSAIPGMNSFSGVDALSTLVHEGRHAWQLHVVLFGGDGADPAARAALAKNLCGYTAGGEDKALYAGQLNEVDARRFERATMEAFAQRLAARTGGVDPSFNRQIGILRSIECSYAKRILERLTVGRLAAADQLAREEYDRRRFDRVTGMGAEDISIFDDARRLLETGDIDGFADGKPLRLGGVEGFAEAETIGESAPLDPVQEALLAQLDYLRPAGGGGVDDTRIRPGLDR